jgi:protein O-mannosyl-transferase
MADRYHYLPSIGILIMAAWGISSLIKNQFIKRHILFPSAVAVVALLAVLTWHQCSYWKNSIELWNHALKATNNNFLAHDYLASALCKEGNIKMALYHYDQSINIAPNYFYPRLNKGVVFARYGSHKLAIDNFNEAIRINPVYAEVYYDRGLSYIQLGQYQHAMEDLNKAILLNKDYINAYLARGSLHLKLGNKELACMDVKKACASGLCSALEVAKGMGYCR